MKRSLLPKLLPAVLSCGFLLLGMVETRAGAVGDRSCAECRSAGRVERDEEHSLEGGSAGERAFDADCLGGSDLPDDGRALR